jgi:hypothetical protein
MALLYVRTGNNGANAAYLVADLGITIPTGASWTLLSASSAAAPDGNSGLFSSRELRDSADLYAAISGGSLEWSKDGSTEETPGSYTSDYMLMQDFTDDTFNLAAARLIAPQGTSLPGTGVEGELFWKTDTDGLYVYQSSTWTLIANNAGTNNDHGGLDGLGDDDHSQYHNDARGDARYFQKTEHIDTSAGVADAGKPIKLDSAGKIADNMLDLEGDDVELLRIGVSTYSTAQHLQDLFHSAGFTSGGAVTDIGSQTARVAAGTGLIRNSASRTAPLYWFDWAQSDFVIPNNTVRYLGIEYNGGSPQAVSRTTYNWNFWTDFPIAEVHNEAGTLYICPSKHAVGDHANMMIQRMYQTDGVMRDMKAGGLVLGETGTRKVTLTDGALWDRLERFDITDKDTNVSDDFTTYYRDVSGLFVKTTGVTTWPNTQYDDGDGTLATMTSGYYANLWWYVTLTDELVMVYGTNEYSSQAGAEAEGVPVIIPDRLDDCAVLVGRFIFQKSASTATVIQSAFSDTLLGGSSSDHGNLSGLSDDDHGQYASLAGDGTRNAVTGKFNLSGGRFRLPQATNVSSLLSPEEGELAWDTDDNKLYVGDGASWVGLDTTLDHGSMLGLGDDDHPQYGHIGQNETVTGLWTFNPTGTTTPAFVIGPNTATASSSLTDGAVQYLDGLLYIYDGTRVKWLSVARRSYTFGRAGNTKNLYLRTADSIATSETGIRVMRNATVVGISAQTDTAGTWVVEIRKNDGASVITSLTLTAVQGAQDVTLNANLDAGDEIQVYANVSGTAVKSPVVSVELAWRA